MITTALHVLRTARYKEDVRLEVTNRQRGMKDLVQRLKIVRNPNWSRRQPSSTNAGTGADRIDCRPSARLYCALKARSMTLCRTAALTLVGWCLMVPLDLNAGSRTRNQEARASSAAERADHEMAKSSADIVDGYLNELAKNPENDLVWTRATALLLGTDILNFSSRLMHLCFGPELPSSEMRKRDCEDLGLKLLSLKQTLLRTAFEREWRMSAQERVFSDQLEAALRRDTEKINPIEVQEKTKLLRTITAALDQPTTDPVYVFIAGEQTSNLSRFILGHCPGQLIWGMSNGSATEECRGLEKAILDFQRAVAKFTSKEPQFKGN